MRFGSKLCYAAVSLIALTAPALAKAQNTPPPPPPPAAADQGTTQEAAADNARQAAAGDQPTGNEIVVEARRRAESNQDVPLVDNAVTSQQITKLELHTFTDITAVVPGLTLVSNTNGIGSASSMRGVNHDINVSGNNGTIQYYLDDVPVGSDIVFRSLFDIGQIEVQRGPQGTLRGRSVPSGSITIATHPVDLREVGGYFEGTYASHATSNLQFAFNVPIISDVLGVRVAGVYDFSRGNDVFSVNSTAAPRDRTEAIRASVRFKPVDWFEAGFTATVLKHDMMQFGQVESFSLIDPTVPTSPGAPDYGTITLANHEGIGFSPSQLGQNIHIYNWHAQASFAGQTLYYVGHSDLTSYLATGGAGSGGFFPSLNLNQTSIVRGVNTSHEVRLQNDERVAGIFDYVAGYFYNRGSSATTLTNATLIQLEGAAVGPGGVITPLFPLGGPSVNITNVQVSDAAFPGVNTEQSFFGNVTAHLGDKAEIAGGLRRIDYKDSGQDVVVSGAVVSPGIKSDTHATIYNVTARYRFSPQFMVYVSSGSSWRPGPHAVGDFSLTQSPNELKHTFLPPETSKNYEGGFKSNFLNNTVYFDLTYYHQIYKDYPFRSPSGIFFLSSPQPGVLTVAEAGGGGSNGFSFISGVPVTVDGIDASAGFHPSRHFSLDANLSYSKSRIGSALVACNKTPVNPAPTVAQLQAALGAEHLGECSASGGSANTNPHWSGSVTGEYSAAVGNHTEAFIRGLFNWRSSTQNDPTNPYDNIKAYGLFNGYVGVRGEDNSWSLTFYAKNLGNVRLVTAVSANPLNQSEVLVFLAAPTFRNVAGTGSATITGLYGGVAIVPPREVGVTLRLAFGSR